MQAQFTLVETLDDALNLKRWMGERRDWLGVDTETGGLDWWREPLRMVQVGDAEHGWAIPFADWAGLVKEILGAYRGRMVFHNAKFDLHFLETNGVRLDRSLIHDSRAMAHILAPNLPSGLKPTSERLIHPAAGSGQSELKLAMMKGKWSWRTVPIDLPQYWVYAALDPVLTARLAERLYPKIQASYQRVYDTEVAVAITLTDMERRGIKIDRELCETASDSLKLYVAQMDQWYLGNFGIKNPSSDREMIKFFQSQGHIFTKTTAKGNVSLDADALAEINHPAAEHLPAYRNALKFRSTYYEDFLDFADGDILHGSINPLGARTGRMSASRPNLQNVPRTKVRNAFLARPGHKLLLADFDQIELRLMAHYAREEGMLDAVRQGEDLHTFIGRMIYGRDINKEERQITKAANFAKIYGAGAAKFGQTAGISTEEAKRFMTTYDSRFPGVRRFMNEMTARVKRGEEIVTPFLGRKQVAEADQAYKIVNYFVQGTAADVLKTKLVELSMTDSEQWMLIPIHDEIAFDVPEEYVEDVKQEVMTVMEDHTSFEIPLTVGGDVVTRWGAKYA